MKCIFFLGAGASAHASMPTTQKLVSMLSDKCKGDSLYEKILREYGMSDIEALYAHIDRFDKTKNNLIITQMEYVDANGNRFKYTEMRERLEELKRHIREMLLESLDPEEDELVDSVRMMDRLKNFSEKRDTEFTIITTNYDLVLERCFSPTSLIDGFMEDPNNPQYMIWRNTWERKPDGIYILKMHGSINWQRNKEGTRIEKTPRVGHRRQERDIMIAPTLDEKDYIETPFKELFQKFENIIKSASLLIVIGYSFRDDKINEALQKWIDEEHLTLLSISQNASISTKEAFNKTTPLVVTGNGVYRQPKSKKTRIYSFDTLFEPVRMDDICKVMERVADSVSTGKPIPLLGVIYDPLLTESRI